MTPPREVLAKQKQHYQRSCAASGMELVLKLHALEPASYCALQDRYGDTNIGFENLADLLPCGIEARDHEPSVAHGFAKIEEEEKAGRFPLGSLPGAVAWHIWVAVIGAGRLRFLKTCIRKLFPLPALIASFGLILAGRVAAQTFTTLH